MSTTPVPTYKRTIDAKPNRDSIVKPGELVDVVEISPLTITDRRLYNQLIGHAWNSIAEPGQHSIPKRELQNTLHKGTERLEDSIRRLMTAIVQVRVINKDGQRETKRVQLLGGNVVPDAEDGIVRYDFHPLMRQIIAESTVFARLHKQIMFALSSKYSLTLYEMIQKRGNLTNKTYEEFTIEEFRGLLGVPKDKLSSWINLKNKAITPAVTEVSALSDYQVTIEPIKGAGRSFSGVRLRWQLKEANELQDLVRELNNTKLGRKARLSGTVENITFVSGGTGQIPPLPPETIAQAKAILPGYDVYFVENEWRTWAKTRPELPRDPSAAFLAFCKKYRASNPL